MGAWIHHLQTSNAFGHSKYSSQSVELEIGTGSTGQLKILIPKGSIRIQTPIGLNEKNYWFRSIRHRLELNLWVNMTFGFEHFVVKLDDDIYGVNAKRSPGAVKLKRERDGSIILTGLFYEGNRYRKLPKPIKFKLVLGRPAKKSEKVRRDPRNPNQSVLNEWVGND